MIRSKSILVSLVCLCLGAKVNDSGHAEGLLLQAAEEVAVFDFARGYEVFAEAMTESERGSDVWQAAVLGKAICRQQVSPVTRAAVEEAASLYQELLQVSADSAHAARALMNLGRIAELSDYNNDQMDLVKARSRYQQVVDRWPTAEIAGEATLRIASTYIQTYRKEEVLQGITLLEKWLADHPDDVLASAMWHYLGDTYMYPLEDYKSSLDCYERADNLGLLEKGREGPVYWRMAVLADRMLQDRARAVRYYTKIVEVVPTSGKAYEAQLALKRLGAPVPEIHIFPDEKVGADDGLAAPQDEG